MKLASIAEVQPTFKRSLIFDQLKAFVYDFFALFGGRWRRRQ